MSQSQKFDAVYFLNRIQPLDGSQEAFAKTGYDITLNDAGTLFVIRKGGAVKVVVPVGNVRCAVPTPAQTKLPDPPKGAA